MTISPVLWRTELKAYLELCEREAQRLQLLPCQVGGFKAEREANKMRHIIHQVRDELCRIDEAVFEIDQAMELLGWTGGQTQATAKFKPAVHVFAEVTGCYRNGERA